MSVTAAQRIVDAVYADSVYEYTEGEGEHVFSVRYDGVGDRGLVRVEGTRVVEVE